MEGRVVDVHLVVGTAVAAGDVLVALDATREQIAAKRARAHVVELAPQVESIERELAAEDDARRNGAAADLGSEQETLAKVRAAEEALAFAERERAREQLAAANGVSPQATRERAETEAKQRKSALEALQHQADSFAAEHRERTDTRRARREQLDRQHGELVSELAAAQAEVARLDHEIELHTIRTPVAGTLGEIVTLRPGAVLHAGDGIATVVPAGALQVVAEYAPAALGRIAPGQPARVRLDAYPWTRFGTLDARVVRVGSETREGTIRVELAIEHAPVPTRHGLSGTVEIEVERLSPAALALRAIGARLDDGTGP